MSVSDGPAGPGGATLFWLSAVILGGLLFAAGVMVGRGLGPSGAGGPADPLAQIDSRDRGPAPRADEGLTFQESLSGPPSAPPARTKPKSDAGPKEAAVVPTHPPKDPDPDPGPKRAAASGADAGGDPAPGQRYSLQVASFRERQQADDLVMRLRRSDLPDVRTVEGEVAGKGMYYRVRLGRFADKETAERFRRSNDLQGLVIRGE